MLHILACERKKTDCTGTSMDVIPMLYICDSMVGFLFCLLHCPKDVIYNEMERLKL